MFTYPEMTTESIEGMRLYITPAGPLPSITTILGGTETAEKTKALTNWANAIGQVNAKRITQNAADRGTAVHTMIERHLKGEVVFSPGEFDQAHVNSYNALKLKLKSIDEVWCQEEALYSDQLGIAGRVDCIGIYKGVESIIDFKTSTRIKSQKDVEDYRIQLACYKLCHDEMFGTNIKMGIILMTSAEGFPQEFKITIDDGLIQIAQARIAQFYRKFLTQ